MRSRPSRCSDLRAPVYYGYQVFEIVTTAEVAASATSERFELGGEVVDGRNDARLEAGDRDALSRGDLPRSVT
jgi:hypothetical protein